MNKEISNRLKECRWCKRMSQEELAELMNVSRSKISSWESGRRDMCITDAIIFVNILNVSMDNLFNPKELSTEEFCKIAKRYFESENISIEEKENTIRKLVVYKASKEAEELLAESK